MKELAKKGEIVKGRIFRAQSNTSFFVGLNIQLSQGEFSQVPAKLWDSMPYPATLPANEVDIGDPGPLRRWVGRRIEAKVLEVNRSIGVIISRRKIIEEKRGEIRQKTLMNTKEGDIVTGRVKTIDEQEVVADISGVEARLPMSEASWYPKPNLKFLFKRGDILDFKVIKIDEEKEKFLISYKVLTPHPADELTQKLVIGSTIEGDVTKVMERGGCFIRISGLRREAYIPPSEVSREEAPQEKTKIKAIVIKIDREKIRAILSQRRYEDAQMPEVVGRYSKEAMKMTLGDILKPTEPREE
ncbi:S1 RNA-binding domain-containing protein [Elusimicrobiota bacterium]